MKAKIHKKEHIFGFQKEEDSMPIVEQKVIEPPSPMKVNDNIDPDKLVIHKDAVETPDSEMMYSKAVVSFLADGAVPSLYSAQAVQSMKDKGWSEERILFIAQRKKKMRIREKEMEEGSKSGNGTSHTSQTPGTIGLAMRKPILKGQAKPSKGQKVRVAASQVQATVPGKIKQSKTAQ
uniref:Uncharacterized protein n=1 Tax=Romanomermis culicivorax TaxID=13658 RepID=A0A915KLT0_ROMCU